MSFSLQSVWERLRGLGRSKRRASQAQAAVTTQSNSHESTAGEAVVDAPSIATNGTTTHQPIASLKLVDDQVSLHEPTAISEADRPIAGGATANSENNTHGKASNQSLAEEAATTTKSDVSGLTLSTRFLQSSRKIDSGD